LVYMQRFVSSILVGNQIQKELANGQVNLPFGAEFTLRLRNKNSRRAVAHVVMDREDCGRFVVDGNSHWDIERPTNSDKKFRFVGLDSAEAIDFGKDGPNDDKVKGLIEVHWYLEKEAPKPPTVIHHHHHDTYYPPYRPSTRPYPWGFWGTTGTSYSVKSLATDASYTARGISDTVGSASSTLGSSADSDTSSVMNFSEQASGSGMLRSKSLHKGIPESQLADGCVVEGSQSMQRFGNTSVEVEDTCVTLKIFLRGFNPAEVDESQHVAPATPRYAPHKATPAVTTTLVGPAKSDVVKAMEAAEARNTELRLRIAQLEQEMLEKQLAALQSA
jgi:hypothetical protein